MFQLLKKIKSDEKGNFTVFVIFIILGVVLLFGLFFNVAITYLNINFAKKALDEAVRSRAMAVDIPLKESIGVIEVMNYPYSGTSGAYNASKRPTTDSLGNTVPCNGLTVCGGSLSPEYKSAVDYAETYAKNNMIEAIDNYTGKDSGNTQNLIDFSPKNICFDVEPLPSTDGGLVTFSCALKSNSGQIYTVNKTVAVKSYNDSDLINSFNDTTLTGTNTKIKVNNVVFGAAIIEPRADVRSSLYRFGYSAAKTRTVIYSIAYPQIDRCYGSFC